MQKISNFFAPKKSGASKIENGTHEKDIEKPKPKEKESERVHTEAPKLKRLRQNEDAEKVEIDKENDTKKLKKQKSEFELEGEDEGVGSQSEKNTKIEKVVVEEENKQVVKVNQKIEKDEKEKKEKSLVMDKKLLKEAQKEKGKGKISDELGLEEEEREILAENEEKGTDDEDFDSGEESDAPAEEKNSMKVFKRKPATSKDKDKKGATPSEEGISNHFHPINSATWPPNEPVPYGALASTLERIENTSSRLSIIEILSQLYRSIIALSPNDLLPAVYLSTNRIAPAYEGIELGIGEACLIKAVAEATGRTPAKIKEDLKHAGDLGLVAQYSRTSQRMMVTPQRLTLQGVFKVLKEIALETGNSSQQRKIDKIKKLLISCKEIETQFIIRSLQGKLRIGLAEKSVISALAKAVTLTPPSVELPPPILDAKKTTKSDKLEENILKANKILTRCYSQLPNYDVLLPTLLKEGLEGVEKSCHLTVGIPVNPMLAQPTKGISEVLDRFQGMDFTCEYKYDGERAQIHRKEDGTVMIYSRNLEDNTKKYPDITNHLHQWIAPSTSSFILDCEVVAWDRSSGKILPFQVLSTRARKGVVESDIKIRVCLFAFDLMYINGNPILHLPLSERREFIKKSFVVTEGEFNFAVYRNIDDVNDIQPFLEEAVNNNCEGLMVKTLNQEASYEPSKRSYNWLKIKKDYLEGMTDSVDLVPIGAWIGKGKRTGGYGGYLMACYDDENDDFQTTCKIGTGFSDEMLASTTLALKSSQIDSKPSNYTVHEKLEPDVWFKPTQVWEVLAADLSISPIHTAAAGSVDSSKGIALRFPRFIKIRDDKNPDQATSATQIEQLYRNQKVNTSSANVVRDEDY